MKQLADSNTTIIIIGGGIAGVSAAHFLAKRLGGERITVVEAEAQLAHHTTGRSAAILIENYGALPVRALTKASLDFLRTPPPDLVDGPVLSPRGSLFAATPEEHDEVERLVSDAKASDVDQRELNQQESAEICPMLREGVHERVLYEPAASDIDVAGLHQAFVRGFRKSGGTILTSHRVETLSRTGDGWRVDFVGQDSDEATQPLECQIVINASGAWGDVVAELAGLRPLGLQPMRRTAFMVASPFKDSEDWPIVSDAKHSWYAKPDGPQFLCSPADETPSEPCDAKPEELDVALAIDRINGATTLGIRSVASSWAGLRSFVPDRALVIGPDPTDSSFVWLVGQGGIGIQTSPGAGQLVADLVATGQPGEAFAELNLDLDGLLPDRLLN